MRDPVMKAEDGYNVFRVKEPIPGLYIRWGQPENSIPVEKIPRDDYVVVGTFGEYLIFAVWLGQSPSSKHRYLVRKTDYVWIES